MTGLVETLAETRRLREAVLSPADHDRIARAYDLALIRHRASLTVPRLRQGKTALRPVTVQQARPPTRAWIG